MQPGEHLSSWVFRAIQCAWQVQGKLCRPVSTLAPSYCKVHMATRYSSFRAGRTLTGGPAVFRRSSLFTSLLSNSDGIPREAEKPSVAVHPNRERLRQQVFLCPLPTARKVMQHELRCSVGFAGMCVHTLGASLPTSFPAFKISSSPRTFSTVRCWRRGLLLPQRGEHSRSFPKGPPLSEEALAGAPRLTCSGLLVDRK